MERTYPAVRESVDLARVATAARARLWLVILLTVAGGLLGYGAAQWLTPTYQAKAEIAYQPSDDLLSVLGVERSSRDPNRVASLAQTIKTIPNAEAVSSGLGGSPSARELLGFVSVEADAESQAIVITAKSSDPELTTSVANGFAQQFVSSRQSELALLLQDAQDLLQQRISTLTPEESQSEYGYSLKSRYDNLRVVAALQKADVQVVREATVPSSAVFPRPSMTIGLGLFLGLVGGILLALALFTADRTVKDEAIIERELGLPILARVPLIQKWGTAEDGRAPIGFRNERSVILESFRMLRSSLKLLGLGASKRSIMVTSATPGEGKSTSAIDLALALALGGDRVVLVDCDLRHPVLHRYLELNNRIGLRNVLLDELNWQEAAQPVDVGRYVSLGAQQARPEGDRGSLLYCLTAGAAVANPAELLDSEQMFGLLRDLTRITDYVILDSPPLLVVADVLPLVNRVDSILLTARLGSYSVNQARELRELLQRANAKTAGVLITGAKMSRDHYHYYHSPSLDAEDRPHSLLSGEASPTQDKAAVRKQPFVVAPADAASTAQPNGPGTSKTKTNHP